jgi:EAL domain-containing protein (putative c-di-GMP-specific phosphodiesterase class I)
MGEVFRRRFQLVTQFRQAVETGRIVVHYQPKLNLAERELVGVEALVRWMHPEFGLVSPSEFVSAIEATGSIDVLLGHVLDVVLGQMRSWTARGLNLGVAVNLSARNLLVPDFATWVGAALARHGVAPNLLTFEITESSVMAEPRHSMPVLRDLHALGIQLSVDDFGTGYSSLAYLRRLPIDEIKIDRSFVQGMVTDLGDLAIVRAIIDLGHSLGLRVVAEGVEEEAARDALRAMRCDNVQGFLLSRPLPVDRFEAWLASRTVRTTQPDGVGAVLRLVG